MTHLVEQIVVAVKAVLTGLTTTGANVFDGEPRVIEAGQLPALIIIDGADSAQFITKFYPRLVAHTLGMSVVAYVKNHTPPDVLRQIRLEVEKAMAAAAPNLGGLTKDIRCTGAGERQQDYDSEVQVAALSINFEIDYRYSEQDPEVAN